MLIRCSEEKYQGDTTFTSQVTGCTVHATEKAIRPLFANKVTYTDYKYAARFIKTHNFCSTSTKREGYLYFRPIGC